MRIASADLSTRARIRDAAIEVFGEQGFATGVRTVAAAAGVSPGLVNHHFGSKEGLREECDAYVLEVIRVAKSDFLTRPSAAGMIQQLAEVERYGSLIAYIVRSFQVGGRLTESLFEHMVSTTEQFLEDGVAAGTLRPSRDPAARARFATIQSLGGLLLFLQMTSDIDGAVDFDGAIRNYSDVTTFPALEIYTEGMFTDSSLLDGYIETRSKTTD